MPDATENPIPPGIFPAGTQGKDASVNLVGVEPALLSFLTRLGLIHMHLFDSVLTITSAKDAIHGKGSKHYVGKAVDIRIVDLAPDMRPVFLMVLYAMSAKYRIAVFDESQLPGGPHVHVELAG